jgi:hypothetical protein
MAGGASLLFLPTRRFDDAPTACASVTCLSVLSVSSALARSAIEAFGGISLAERAFPIFYFP